MVIRDLYTLYNHLILFVVHSYYGTISIKQTGFVVITAYAPFTVNPVSYNVIMESGVFWRTVAFVLRPLLWQGAKAMGSEALVTRPNKITAMSRNTYPKTQNSRHRRRKVTELAHRVVNKLSGQYSICKRATSNKEEEKQKRQRNNLREVKQKEEYLMGHLTAFIPDLSMAAEALSVSSEFDIFAQKQTNVCPRQSRLYRQIASVDNADLEFLNPAENDTYIDMNIRLLE